MELQSILFIIVFLAAIILLVYSLRVKYQYMKLAQPDDRCGNVQEKIKNVLVVAFGQSKLLRDKPAGILHFLIFWGFMLFLFSVVEAIIHGFSPGFSFSFLGPFFSIITLTQDVFGVLVILAVLFAFYRRFVQKVERLDVGKHAALDASFILLLILFVVLSMFGQNISLVAAKGYFTEAYEIRPVSEPLAKLFYGDSFDTAYTMFQVFWWMHIVLVLGFMNYLPYSKHFHVITSIPNVFFANSKKVRNTIKPLDLEDEEVENFGAEDFNHLTWKQVLDGYSCTECGRCTANCPANISGKTLSPRKIITDIRDRTLEKAPMMLKGIEEGDVIEKTLLHNYISDKELWQCTTCFACVQECPVMIEHVDSIIQLRRYLVLDESQFPNELTNVFKNLEANFTPWAFSNAERADWAEGLDIKTMKDDPEGEVLFWVGCAGSYDDRFKKVSVAFAKLMQKAGIDFRILGTEEKCNGDTARRLGNEYLAQFLMTENIETLNNYKVKKIVATCPHCFNSLKNEYPQFGGNFEVVHHSEFILDLVDQGKIKLKDGEFKKRITYHDSCYLGRYNDIYEQPRKTISSIPGVDYVEMERNKSRGFCCGAGGGRMFLEDVEGNRVNIERTKEALSVDPEIIGTACPFCMTMLSDGTKELDKEEKVIVKDIAELVLENSV